MTARQVATIALSKIDRPGNVRKDLGDLKELKASIQAVGLIEPLVVRPGDEKGRYDLLAGDRRMSVLESLKWTEAPARILPKGKPGDREATRVAVQLVENLQRLDLDPIEEAAGYLELKELGWKQKDIAKTVGRSPAVVSKRLSLLDLPDKALELLSEDKIGPESLYQLTKVADAGGDLNPILEAIESNETDDDYRAEEIEYMVEQATEKARTDAELAARKLEYEGKGIKVHVAKTDDFGRPVIPKDRLGYDLDLDHDDHLKEPCAMVSLFVQWGSLVEAQHCTDKRRHAEDGVSDLKIPTLFKPSPRAEAEAKSRRRSKQLGELAQAALEEKRLPARDRILQRVVELYIESVWAEVRTRAAKWLDLSAEADADDRGLLGIYQDAKPDDRFRILLALALAHGHSNSTGSYVNEESPRAVEALEFLADVGHPYKEDD